MRQTPLITRIFATVAIIATAISISVRAADDDDHTELDKVLIHDLESELQQDTDGGYNLSTNLHQKTKEHLIRKKQDWLYADGIIYVLRPSVGTLKSKLEHFIETASKRGQYRHVKKIVFYPIDGSFKFENEFSQMIATSRRANQCWENFEFWTKNG